jgi:hypothetical protein
MTLSISAFTEGDEMGARAVPCQGWQPIETAPRDAAFLAIDREWDVQRCWRHNPSSRTDEILTWRRNSRFRATHWRPLDPPPSAEPSDAGPAPTKAEPSTGRLVTQDPPALPEREAVARVLDMMDAVAAQLRPAEGPHIARLTNGENVSGEVVDTTVGLLKFVANASTTLRALLALPPSRGGER